MGTRDNETTFRRDCVLADVRSCLGSHRSLWESTAQELLPSTRPLHQSGCLGVLFWIYTDAKVDNGVICVFIFFFSFSQYPFELGLVAAFVFSMLVCLSRLYTGMHTVLVRMPHTGCASSSVYLQRFPSPTLQAMCVLHWPCHCRDTGVMPLNPRLYVQRQL